MSCLENINEADLRRTIHLVHQQQSDRIKNMLVNGDFGPRGTLEHPNWADVMAEEAAQLKAIADKYKPTLKELQTKTEKK